MAASTRCWPGGPVPRPRPTAASAGRCRPERRLRAPRRRIRTRCPDATHTLPLSDPPAGNRDQRGTTPSTGTGSHRRPVRRADCAMGSMSPPERRSPQGAWADGRRGRPTGQRARARATGPDHRGLTVAVAGWSVAAFAQTAFGIPILRHFGSTTSWSRHFGHLVPTSDIGGTDHAVPRAAASARTPTTPAYPYTGVALPGRSHVRVCRPVFMLCPARIAGIRCFAFSGHSDHMPCTTAVPGRRCGDSCLTRYLPSA